jgi:surface antigen
MKTISPLVLVLMLFSQNASALQCVDYVNNQLYANGYKKLSGTAIEFASSTKNKGISVSSSPSSNRVVVFDGTRIDANKNKIPFSSVGHVGWVTSVSGNNMKFSDANFNFDGKTNTHAATKYNSWSTIKVDGGASSYNIKGYVTAPKR